jgi:hypothetical protein
MLVQRAAAVDSGGDLRRIAMPLVLKRLFSCGVAAICADLPQLTMRNQNLSVRVRPVAMVVGRTLRELSLSEQLVQAGVERTEVFITLLLTCLRFGVSRCLPFSIQPGLPFAIPNPPFKDHLLKALNNPILAIRKDGTLVLKFCDLFVNGHCGISKQE